MYRYTLCLLKSENEVLLLNREKPPAMGLWNGVGGKIESGETVEASVCREVFEETGYKIEHPLYKGEIILHGEQQVGMHLFVVEVTKHEAADKVQRTREGILEWKQIDWVLHPDNMGIISNLKQYLQPMLDYPMPRRHTFRYDGHELLTYTHDQLDEASSIVHKTR
ncbi:MULTISPECIES: 8-oxo-dGTP diphosphatase [unclassified Exiguobacterium]|uniref:NUDIX hydrolase n=1 Tax=unclassified Exiguobacterium TaxID=2644629 RepID=UPI001BEC1EDB|nr:MULTISPECIES: 8-oxo-dGTP diphosphatase [unclassified Exiguobacterium]